MLTAGQKIHRLPRVPRQEDQSQEQSVGDTLEHSQFIDVGDFRRVPVYVDFR